MMRLPPRRILAAVDFSVVSRFAWDAARRIAERFGARLDAVYCEPLDPETAVYGAASRGKARRRELLGALRRRLGPGGRLHVVSGDPAGRLLKLVEDRGYDLLVMGTHRRGGVSRFLLGSVAEAVAKDCPCPVLIVPRRMRETRWVLAPIHEADYARRGLRAAAVVARAYKARLAVLNVTDDPIFEGDKRLQRRRIAELPDGLRREVRPVSETKLGEPVEGIVEACRGRDLLVLAAHRKSFLHDLAVGTTAQRLIRRSPIPVLTIPESPRRAGREASP